MVKKMIELGISLYPEQETLEAMENYIKLASSYGFTKIFSSMFSVPGQPEDVKNLFKTLCKIAHNANMEVCVDVNTQMFSVYVLLRMTYLYLKKLVLMKSEWICAMGMSVILY